MQQMGVRLTAVAFLFVLFGCSGDESGQPPVRVVTVPPTPSEQLIESTTPLGLPGDWYEDSSEPRGMMLKKTDDEDAWIWVHLEDSVSGSDVERGLAIHRRDVESSPAGTYIESGSVETQVHGLGAWSLAFEEGGDERDPGKNELVLYLPFPRRNTILALRYLYPPGGPETDARLTELVAVADGLSLGP